MSPKIRQRHSTPLHRSSPAVRVPVPEELRLLLSTLGELAERQGSRAYAVGGCVRDWLLGPARTTDVDVAVEGGDVMAFAKDAARALGASLQTHQQFGTATLLVESPASTGRARSQELSGTRIDLAMCRRETYAHPVAYPNVSAGSLQDDLARRDFTINAMAMTIDREAFGALIDPFGGREDLRQRRLRILHAKSFVDDPSRILRGARFAERLALRLEPKTARQMRAAVAAGWLSKLNAGRVRKELNRLVDEPRPFACLATLGEWLKPVRRHDRRRTAH